QRGGESEQDAVDHCYCQGEAEDGGIGTRDSQPRNADRRDGGEDVPRDHGEEISAQAAEDSERTTLDEKLPDDPSRRRPQRHPDWRTSAAGPPRTPRTAKAYGPLPAAAES